MVPRGECPAPTISSKSASRCTTTTTHSRLFLRLGSKNRIHPATGAPASPDAATLLSGVARPEAFRALVDAILAGHTTLGPRERDGAVVLTELRSADDLATAYARAFECDPRSAFGGIVATNRPNWRRRPEPPDVPSMRRPKR